MKELSPEQKLANLRSCFERWEPNDVPLDFFVQIYKEVGRALLNEADRPYLEFEGLTSTAATTPPVLPASDQHR